MAHLAFTWLYKLIRKFIPTPAPKLTYATATTPDALIAERVIGRMARDVLEGWTRRRKTALPTLRREFAIYDTWMVSNSDSSIRVEWHGDEYTTVAADQFKVNDVPISMGEGKRILQSYLDLKLEKDRLATVARKAKQEMEDNDKKWNLVEDLYGLMRTPEGALIPKPTEPIGT